MTPSSRTGLREARIARSTGVDRKRGECWTALCDCQFCLERRQRLARRKLRSLARFTLGTRVWRSRR